MAAFGMPQLNAYAMSFLVISIYWLAHRRFMAMILSVDAPLTILTLVILGLVVLIPPATRLISAHSAYPVARVPSMQGWSFRSEWPWRCAGATPP